ncbi:hypothetical protein AB2S62_04345 [Vibrio sp. NTOU-M3]|uniref:hypothetical protein n=1 Tax=Vibrio sp. NTOU-M3 TaxID=3234954 RepID=UPI00349FB96B
MEQKDKDYWQYGDKWSKAFPLRLPPAQTLRTFFILSGILFALWGMSLITLYEDIIGVPSAGGNKGGDPLNNYIVLPLLSYLVWIWRYTAPLSLCHYHKDSYNRPALNTRQHWLATAATLVLGFVAALVCYYLLVPEQYR